MESRRPRIFWLKNSAWKGCPPWYSAARPYPRKRSWKTSSAARRIFLKTLASATMSPSSWSNAISTAPRHSFIHKNNLWVVPRPSVVEAVRPTGLFHCEFVPDKIPICPGPLSAYWHPVHCAGLLAPSHLARVVSGFTSNTFFFRWLLRFSLIIHGGIQSAPTQL